MSILFWMSLSPAVYRHTVLTPFEFECKIQILAPKRDEVIKLF